MYPNKLSISLDWRPIIFEISTEENELKKVISDCLESGVIAIDTETDSLRANEANLVGISISTNVGNGCYIPLAHKKNDNSLVEIQLSKNIVLPLIKNIFEDNSILNIPVFDSYWDKEIYFTNSDGRETNPINYNQFRNTLVLDGSIDENNFVFDNDDRFKYSLRKSLEIGRINGGGWGNDWTNIFYPNTTVINVLGRKPAGFINWYVNPTLDVMTQEDYGKSDSTETKQDEPPSKREVKMPIQPHPDDELIVEGDDDDDEAGIREQDYYGYGRGYMAWRRRRNNPDEN